MRERERIDVLREELDVELQTLEQGRAALAPASGRDASGTIVVRLDADALVTAVHSDGSWRQHLEPDRLPAAVLEAYGAAVTARQEQYLTGIDQAEPGRARPASGHDGVLAHDVLDAMRQHGGTLPQSMLRSLDAMLDDLDRGLDEAFAMVEEQLASTISGRSTSGHARAEVSGSGDLVGVSYDARWLGTAHAFNVGRETTEAIHDALRRRAGGQPGHGVEAIAEASGLARLRDLTCDPEALTRHLGI